jgi:hypothetical protein
MARNLLEIWSGVAAGLDDRLLLARSARLQGKPLGLCGSVAWLEDVLEDDVKLAHVVLAEAVLVPAHDFEQESLLALDGHLEGCVPFWVECLVDGGGGFAGVTEGEDEVGVRGATAVLCSEVASLGELAGLLCVCLSLSIKTHPEDVDAQGKRGRRFCHCALWAGLSAVGQARRRGGGAVVVVLEAGGERQLGGESGPWHLG